MHVDLCLATTKQASHREIFGEDISMDHDEYDAISQPIELFHFINHTSQVVITKNYRWWSARLRHAEKGL